VGRRPGARIVGGLSGREVEALTRARHPTNAELVVHRRLFRVPERHDLADIGIVGTALLTAWEQGGAARYDALLQDLRLGTMA